MQAQILGFHNRFEVEQVTRDDGTRGWPDRIAFTTRPCWRKPPQRVELEFLYELEGVAYYGVRKHRDG